MILLHRYYTYFKRSLFEQSHQKEFNGSNFVSIEPLEGKKMKKVLKN